MKPQAVLGRHGPGASRAERIARPFFDGNIGAVRRQSGPIASERFLQRRIDSVQSHHHSRCIRWEHLAGIDDPRKLFVTDEIGVVENPATLVETLPDVVQVEDLSVVEKRLDEQRESEESSS